MADGQPKARKKENIVVKDFGGINTKADRTAIKNNEFAWLENVMPLGHGNLKWVPGISASTVTFSGTVAYEQFVDILNIPYVIHVFSDGSSIARRIDTNANVTVAAAAALTSSTQIAQWQNTQALFIDPTKGYGHWDGTTFAILNAALKGTSIAVFAGRAWFALGRTVYYSVPSDYTDFAGAGSGNIVLVDSTLVSDIRQLLTANNFLYVFGDSSINVFSDVRVVGGVTVFTNTNISASVGTDLPFSICTYARSLLIMNRYGVHALVGSTTSKISDELDGIFQLIDFTKPVIAGLVLVRNIQCAAFKFVYDDPDTGPRSLLAVFFEKKWFLVTANQITWMSSVIYRGESLLYATSGRDFVQLLADDTISVAGKIQSALWSQDNPITDKLGLKFGIEAKSDTASFSITVDSPTKSSAATVKNVDLEWINDAGTVVSWTNNAGDTVLWAGIGYSLLKGSADMMGAKYIGLTIQATTTKTTIGAMMMQIEEGADW